MDPLVEWKSPRACDALEKVPISVAGDWTFPEFASLKLTVLIISGVDPRRKGPAWGLLVS